MTVTFPLQPRMEFYTEDGKRIVFTAPILHRFLSDLFDRTGGNTSAPSELFQQIDQVRSDILSTIGKLTKLSREVQGIKLDDSDLQTALAAIKKIRRLELQIALQEAPVRQEDIGGYIWAGVL